MCSIDKILTLNIKCNNTVKIKGNDNNPENKESLLRKGTGPLSRNFDSPKADENRLSKKVATGKGGMVDPASPSGFGGKKLCVANMIAREICT